MKWIIVIEEMVGMDILCFDKIGILMLNCFIVDKYVIEVLSLIIDKEVILFIVVWVFCIEN